MFGDLHHTAFRGFSPLRLPSDRGLSGSRVQSIDEEVESFLEQSASLIEKGSRLYFSWLSLKEALLAYRENNYGIGSVVALKKDEKVYIFRDRNAMVTGRRVHDHAEARAIFKAKRFESEILHGNTLPDEERRSYAAIEPDEILDADTNPYTSNMQEGLHVYGTLEPCPMCMCIACRAGAVTSLSGSLDGEWDAVPNAKVSNGGGYVLGEKIQNIPLVCEYIIGKLGLKFALLDTDDDALAIHSIDLSKKVDGALRRAEDYLANTQDLYLVGEYEYYARAALQEAVSAKQRGDDGRGAVVLLVKKGHIYEFREGDRQETGLGVKDIAASRALEAACAFNQDHLDYRYIPDAERKRYQPRYPTTSYPKSTNEFTATLNDGRYLFTTVELDPQGMFVAMNAGVSLAICNAEDGDLMEGSEVVRSQGAAAAYGPKVSALPLKWQKKIQNAGLVYELLKPEEGEDPALVKKLAELSERLFSSTRQEIDDMLGGNAQDIVEDVPEHFELCFEASEIDIAIASAVGEVKNWIRSVQKDGGNVMVVANLHGGDFVLSDLRPYLPINIKYGFIKTSSYKEGSIGEEKDVVSVVANSFVPEELSSNTYVLFIDDICDRGRSLKKLHSWAVENGIDEARIKTLVLLRRIHETSVFEPTWSVFSTTGNKWFVGRGMQEYGLYRGCRNIYSIPNPNDPST